MLIAHYTQQYLYSLKIMTIIIGDFNKGKINLEMLPSLDAESSRHTIFIEDNFFIQKIRELVKDNFYQMQKITFT